MALEQERTSRDYLFGRLLAIAEDIEATRSTPREKKAKETSAARLMQRFADHPASTWRTIELSLRPYITGSALRAPGHCIKESLFDEIVALLNHRIFWLTRH